MSLLVATTLLALAACTGEDDLPWVSLEPPLALPKDDERAQRPLRVGVAPVLSAVSSFEHYNPLITTLAERVDRPAVYTQRGTYHEINELTRRGAVDLSFVCTGAWLLNGEGLEVLAVPLLADGPYYRAVCLSQGFRGVAGFEDLEGSSFGVTDTLSFTGRAYSRARLAQLGTTPEAHFGSVVQVEGHDVLLHMLAQGEIAGGCVNSVVYQHYLEEEPELMANLAVFERSDPFGAPPVLVSQQLQPELRQELLEALTTLGEDERGRSLLEALHVRSFAAPPTGLFDSARAFLASEAPPEAAP
jgi:phosphonate transport system substrate-binding protein